MWSHLSVAHKYQVEVVRRTGIKSPQISSNSFRFSSLLIEIVRSVRPLIRKALDMDMVVIMFKVVATAILMLEIFMAVTMMHWGEMGVHGTIDHDQTKSLLEVSKMFYWGSDFGFTVRTNLIAV